MGLADDTTVKVLLGGFLLSLLALVGVVALGTVTVLAAFFDPTGALLAGVLQAAAPFVAATAVLGLFSVLLLVGLVVAAVRRASLPRDERLARLARLAERHSSEARELGLSERLEPTTEDRIDELKREYVEGEITELEYERRLQDLMADDEVSDERVRRERERTDYEFER